LAFVRRIPVDTTCPQNQAIQAKLLVYTFFCLWPLICGDLKTVCQGEVRAMLHDLDDFLALKKPAACPQCDSDKVAWISYGLPSVEAVEDAQEEGDVVFGGCVIDVDSPPFCCKSCSHRWGNEERQRWVEAKESLPREIRSQLFRRSLEKVMQERAEREERRERRVWDYYRDRHARRHGLRRFETEVFEVACGGARHRVLLNGRGQLIFPDHPHRRARAEASSTQPESAACDQILRAWPMIHRDMPEEMMKALHKLRIRGDTRRRYKATNDPLLEPLQLRLNADAARACHQAEEIFRQCSYSFVRDQSLSNLVRINVRSRTRHGIKISVEKLPRRRAEAGAESVVRQLTTVELSLSTARRWLRQVHRRGLSCLSDHFVFETSEVGPDRRMRVTAAREVVSGQMILAEALAGRGEDGEWHLQWIG
jgi:hypothetical protein